jgi:hypothetical protein
LEDDSDDFIFNKMGRRLTSTWLFETTWTRTFPGDGSVVQEPMTSCGADVRRDRRT